MNSKPINAPQGTTTGRITHYSYDPLGRRISKRTQPLKNGQPAGEAEITYYGWDGERLVLTERGQQQIHTIYEPNSFIPMIRVEGAKGPATQTLAEKMQQQVQAKLTPDNVRVIDGIERELRADSLTPQTQRYLIAARLSPLALLEMLDPEPDLKGKTIHFYHCDHLGTPLMLISQDGEIDWSAELDPWGKVISEHNPKQMYQPIRMQGQHYDEESGLHYNRHRYYDPEIGSYISPDPIGLAGGLNPYSYVENNPVMGVDPLGLAGDYGKCLANVQKFINDHQADAQKIADGMGHGVTASEVLAISGLESGWGDTTQKIVRNNNFFGIHGDGPLGSYRAAKPPHPKVAMFPADNGFMLSGQKMANMLRPHLTDNMGDRPFDFFTIANQHGFAVDNPNYAKEMMTCTKSRRGMYILIKACMEK